MRNNVIKIFAASLFCVVSQSALHAGDSHDVESENGQPIWSCPDPKSPERAKLIHGQELAVLDGFLSLFKSADANKDGKVTLSEASRKPEILPDFNKIDRDNNGVIIPSEVSLYLDGGIAAQVMFLVENADVDGSGSLSKAEAENSYKLIFDNFSEIDKDKSDEVDAAEIILALKRSKN